MILANVSDGRKEYVLPHTVYCACLGRCACGRDPRRVVRPPARLALREGERRFVARSVLSVPEIARAVSRGRLRVEGGGE